MFHENKMKTNLTNLNELSRPRNAERSRYKTGFTIDEYKRNIRMDMYFYLLLHAKH